MRNLTHAQKMFMSQVIIVTNLLLVPPATNAVSERSCSALRTTMTQKRLNNCMLLHVHKEKVDNFNIIDIANEFGCANESSCPLLVNLVNMTFKHAQIIASNFVYALKQICFVWSRSVQKSKTKSRTAILPYNALYL